MVEVLLVRTTNWQMFRFAVVLLIPTATIFLVPLIIKTSSYQGWIALIGGCLLSFIMLYFTIHLGKINSKKAWVYFGEEITGKWVHRLVVFILLCWSLYFVAYNIQGFTLFFGSYYLRGTPPLFIQIILGLVIIYTASLSFTTIIYMADGIFIIFIVVFVLSMYLFVPNADFSVLPALLHYHDFKLVLFAAPEIQINSKMNKKLIFAGLFTLLFILISWLLTIVVLGVHLGHELRYPYLQMMRLSSQNNLLGNADPLLIGLWSSSLFIQSAFLIYIAYKCAAYLTKNKGTKYMIPALTSISVFIAFLYSRHLSIYNLHFNSFYTSVIWLGIECIPIYYSFIALFTYRKRKHSNQ
jgi:spore germination protein KB